MALETRAIARERCRERPAIEERRLISAPVAAELAGVFRVLANESRLRLLHALIRQREIRVTDLAASVGMRPQAVSNQLQRLADKAVVASRRDGTSILYWIADPCVRALLDRGLCLLEDSRARPIRRPR